jgi:hypothetical protein
MLVRVETGGSQSKGGDVQVHALLPSRLAGNRMCGAAGYWGGWLMIQEGEGSCYMGSSGCRAETS